MRLFPLFHYSEETTVKFPRKTKLFQMVTRIIHSSKASYRPHWHQIWKHYWITNSIDKLEITKHIKTSVPPPMRREQIIFASVKMQADECFATLLLVDSTEGAILASCEGNCPERGLIGCQASIKQVSYVLYIGGADQGAEVKSLMPVWMWEHSMVARTVRDAI